MKKIKTNWKKVKSNSKIRINEWRPNSENQTVTDLNEQVYFGPDTRPCMTYFGSQKEQCVGIGTYVNHTCMHEL